MMKSILLGRETFVWIVLAALTLASWVMGNKYAAIPGEYYLYLSLAMILLAFFKVRLVVMNFMEVAHGPLPLRLVFEAWLLICTVVLCVIYFQIHTP